MLITFEGPEGGGKSTQIRLLERRLVAAGENVVVTREPGGTPIAEKIREILLTSEHLTPEAELLLMEAGRAEHLDKLIFPSLEEGKIVLCDRFTDSSTAYQGCARYLGYEWVRKLNAWVCGTLKPSITFLLDLPIEEGFKRVYSSRGAADRIERASLAFHQDVRDAYLQMAEEEPDRFYIVDALLPIEEQHQLIWDKYLEKS